MEKGQVRKRGARRGEGVERRPSGEAEHDAKRAEGNVPIDPRTKQPIEPEKRGRLEPGGQRTD